jgi:hypothetical protein
MGETPDQIEREIAESRQQLHENFQELEDNVKAAMDWKTQFTRRPGTMLALAVGGGILASAILPSRHTSRRAGTAKSNTDSERNNVIAPPNFSSPAVSRPPSDLRKSFEVMQAALLAVASRQASAFIDTMLPGFQDEFAKAKADRGRGGREFVPESGPDYGSADRGSSNR